MSTVVKDLGAVSAYAYAVEKGYTGTEAEFAELMADYAEVGQRAEDAADSALESKTAAQTAATTATNKASEATTAAQTATAKAGEAQTSAQTASSKASEASQSASTASQKATEASQSATNAGQSAQTAEQAKTASQTAQGLAESARDSAISAKNDAESARDAVQASASQIAQNTTDIADLKEDFTDEITKLKNGFSEIAELTTSRNLLDKTKVLDNKKCNVDGVISDYNGRYVTDYIPVTPGKIVTSSYYKNATGVQTVYAYSIICCYDQNKDVVTGGNINQNTFTVPSGVYFVRITYASSMIVYDGMVELTDDGQFTAYEPYTDEKSYTLTDNVNVPLKRVTGLENRLADDEDDITALENSVNAALDTGILFNFSGFIRFDGALIDNASYVSTDYVDILSGGTFVPYSYRLQMFANTKIAYYNESKVFISAISPSESSTLEYVEGIVPYVDDARYVRFCTAKNAVGYYVKYASVKNVVVNGATDRNPCNYSGSEMSVFNKVLCIGDSLTSGTFNYRVGSTTGNYIEDAKYSYPTYLKKLTGCETTNMGNGGRSSAEWYNAHKNDDLSGYDCAIIQLGVNDRIRYTTWGETSETAFTNIINKLKTENKNIKIFVANIIPATSYSDAQYLAFSEDLLAWVQTTYANDQNVIPLDMQQYGHTKDSPAYNCGHLSALGYCRLAQDYKGYIGWYINQNKTVFKEVQFIGTDYYYDPI